MARCDVLTQGNHFDTKCLLSHVRNLLSLWATWLVPSWFLMIVIIGRGGWVWCSYTRWPFFDTKCLLSHQKVAISGLHGQFHHTCWQLLSQVEIFRYAIINRTRLLNIYYPSLMVLYNWLTRGHVYTDGSNCLADRLYQPCQGCLPRSTVTWGCIIQTTISENLYGVKHFNDISLLHQIPNENSIVVLGQTTIFKI